MGLRRGRRVHAVRHEDRRRRVPCSLFTSTEAVEEPSETTVPSEGRGAQVASRRIAVAAETEEEAQRALEAVKVESACASGGAAIRGATRTPATCLVGTGLGTSTQSIFDTLAALTGYETPVRYGPERPGDIQRIWLDASRAREVWGWSAEVPFAEGMARTVEWFRERAES